MKRLISLLVMSLFALVPMANPGVMCPYCETDVDRHGCFACVINPAPAFCSCSTTGSCPQVVTECGYCHGTTPCGGSYCNDLCPGCCTLPGGNQCCAAPAPGAAVKPIIGEWRKNSSIYAAAKTHSPLLALVLEHLQDLGDQDRACTYRSGLVRDQITKEISRVSIVTDPTGRSTTARVYTRSSDREDTLMVHPGQGTWLLSRTGNVLGDKAKMTTLAEGSFQPTEQALSSDLQIKPVNDEWRFNAEIITAAAEHSPLLSTALAHLQQLSDQERSVHYLDGRVIDKQTKEISRLSIVTNPKGITTVKIYTRSTDQEDLLVVNPVHGKWEMSRTSNVLAPNSRTIVTLAKGEFPPTP